MKKLIDIKSTLKKELPHGFKIHVSDDKTYIQLWFKCKNMGSWKDANDAVRSLSKKYGLSEVGAGTDLSTGVRDWDLRYDAAVSNSLEHAKEVLKAMKDFFKKNKSYADNEKVYDIVEQMRSLVSTDEY